jgi:TamB, inner membrane protein subunit of TAM complex
LDLEHMMVVGPDASLDVRGRYTFSEKRFDELHARGWLRDSSVLHIDALPRGGVEIDADISGRWPEIDGRVFVRAAELETQVLGSVRAEASARSSHGRIDIDELMLESRFGRILVRGEAGTLAEWTSGSGSKCLRLDALVWSDAARKLSLAEPVDVELAPRGVVVKGLDLTGDGVSVDGDIALDGPNGRARSSVHAADPTPWIAPFAHGVRCSRLDCDLDANWSAVDVEGTLRGKALRLEIVEGAPASDVELAGSLKEKRATIEKLSVAAVPVSVSERSPAPNSAEPNGAPHAAESSSTPLVFQGEFPLDLRGAELLPVGPIRLQGAFEIRDLDLFMRTVGSNPRSVTGRLRADLDLSGTWDAPRGSVHFDAADLSWKPRESEPAFGPCALHGEIDLDRDLSIHTLTLDLPAGVHASCGGSVHGPFDLRRAVEGDVAAWKELPLDLKGYLEASDLARLTQMIPSLRRLGGKLEGDVGISGTLDKPNYSGALELSDGEVRAASALPALSGITAKLVLEGERVRLDALHGEMGGAPFSLSGSLSPFGADPSVDLSLEGKHLLLYRASGLRVRANANLSVAGPLRAMTIRGGLELDDSRFTRNFDFLAAFGPHSSSPPLFSRPLFELPPPFDTTVLEVKIDAASPFLIANNVLKGGVRPNLQLVGTGGLPILRGTIVINATSVSLPSGKITTRSGTVEFLPSAPFAPNIDALADTRMQGYDIKIHLTGTIENPVVDLSSVPPLAHEDLLLLVLTGTLPRTDQKSPTGMQAAKQVAVYFANDVVSSWFRGSGGDPTDTTELLEVETGQDASQTGVESATARLRVWNGIFSKNSSLYVTGERDIYDRYNFGLRILFRFR